MRGEEAWGTLGPMLAPGPALSPFSRPPPVSLLLSVPSLFMFPVPPNKLPGLLGLGFAAHQGW